MFLCHVLNIYLTEFKCVPEHTKQQEELQTVLMQVQGELQIKF
jgi:hypothetical protein